jgi:signal transduction histidine kinase
MTGPSSDDDPPDEPGDAPSDEPADRRRIGERTTWRGGRRIGEQPTDAATDDGPEPPPAPAPRDEAADGDEATEIEWSDGSDPTETDPADETAADDSEMATPATSTAAGATQTPEPSPAPPEEPPDEPPDEPTEGPAEAVEIVPAPRVATVRFRLDRRVRLVFALAIVLALVLTAAGTIAFLQVLDAREELVDRADPGLLASSDLLAALVDQETGVRAYVLSADESFLEPYERGAAAADDARAELDRAAADLPEVRAQLEEVDQAIAGWRDGYAEPTLDEVRAGDRVGREEAELRRGRTLFDEVRTEVGDLQAQLTTIRADARDRLNSTTLQLLLILAITALVVAAIAAFLFRLMRRNVQAPLHQLGQDAHLIAEGDLDHPVEPTGPVELQALAVAMEQMRQRIVDELAAVTQARDTLERQTGDLSRSNAELEQFAYVASHDLQEPLRKVASFCQLLQSRYGGQLDERADQYIAFAVDGAKRMQALINDLLALSRVGRTPADAVVVRASHLVDEALENLSDDIEATEAKITVVGPLPRVRVEKSLGVALFQNLVSNSLKFRRPEVPPSVHVSVRRTAGFHEFTVADEGIGIEPEYAERIFVIFQRLHGRDDFGGTGIGLALCRKIVEGQGGRIWVDTGGHAGGDPGTTIRFTLPVVEGDA